MAFVLGRSILDNALILFEIIHYMKRKSKKNVGDVALKIDINKAYDRVDWEFLQQIMIKLRFVAPWVDIIMLYITSISYSVVVNDNMVEPIKPKYGLHHGDPLSPYLFIICAEGLPCLIKNVVAKGLSHGSEICKGAPSILFLFVDDIFSSSGLLHMSATQ